MGYKDDPAGQAVHGEIRHVLGMAGTVGRTAQWNRRLARSFMMADLVTLTRRPPNPTHYIAPVVRGQIFPSP